MQHCWRVGRKDYAGGGLSPRTVRYIATILHRAFKDAVRWGRLARNPVDASDPPKASAHQTPERMPWTAEQATIFLDGTRSSRHWTAYFVLATTGLRRGECLGLRWSDLDLDAGRASIRQTVIAVRHTPMFGTPKTAKGSALGQARRWHRRSTARAPEAAERRAPHDGRRMAGPRSGVLPR
jgi:integrase